MMPSTPPQSHVEFDTPPTPRYGPMEDPSPVSKRKMPIITRNTGGLNTPHRGKRNTVTKTPNRITKTPSSSHSATRVMLTPADTPVVTTKRAPVEVLETTKKTGRVLFPPANIAPAGSGRVRHHGQPHTQIHTYTVGPTTPRTSRVRKPTNDNLLKTKIPPQFSIFSDSAAVRTEANGDDPFVCPDAPKVAASLPHPHCENPDPKVPGLWYNFRGKKHYRPFKQGEGLDLKPKVLFKEEIEKQSASMDNDSDPFGGGPIGGSATITSSSGDPVNDSEAETDEDADPLSSFSEEIANLS